MFKNIVEICKNLFTFYKYFDITLEVISLCKAKNKKE